MNEKSVAENSDTGRTSPRFTAHASLVLVGLMAVLPFLQLHHARPIPAFYTEFSAFSLGLLALTLLLTERYWRGFALPWIAFAPLGLLAALLLQLGLGRPAYPEMQVIALLYLLWALLLVILGAALRKEFGLMAISTTLAWFFLVGGELSAGVGILQHYGTHTFLDDFIVAKNRAAVFANVGQTNHFANHISLALASLIFLFATARLSIRTAVPLALPLLFVLPLSSSRSPWLYLFALLALALLLNWRGNAGVQGRKLTAAAILLIAGFAWMQWLVQTSWFAAPMGVITAADRMFEQAAGTSIRFYLWREAWQMFLQAPLLGIGAGQFAWHHFQLLTAYQNPEITGIYSHAHNLVMHLLAETGLAGTLPVAGGIALWLAGLKRQTYDPALWWLLALLTIIGIHSLLEYPLWYGHFLGVTAFLLGAGETRFVPLRLPRLGKPATLLLLILGGGVMIGLEQDYRRIESVMPAGDNQSKFLNDGDIDVLHALHGKTLLAPYVDYALASAMALDQEKLDLKLAINRRVLQFNPSGPVAYKQAILLALKGEHEAAVKQAENAALAFPDDLEAFSDSLTDLAIENQQALQPLLAWADRKAAERR